MGIVIGAKPESSFADPLGLLSDCHRRIEKFLHTLIVITSQAEDDPLTAEPRQALEVAPRYFREASPRHTRDEEDSLFPKLRACGSEAAQAALDAVDALEADHERAEAGHAEVEHLGRKWLDEGWLDPTERARLADELRSLQSLYSHHIQIEDTRIFPLAAHLLDPQTLQGVSREMAEQRGIDLDALPDLKLRCPTRRQSRYFCRVRADQADHLALGGGHGKLRFFIHGWSSPQT